MFNDYKIFIDFFKCIFNCYFRINLKSKKVLFVAQIINVIVIIFCFFLYEWVSHYEFYSNLSFDNKKKISKLYKNASNYYLNNGISNNYFDYNLEVYFYINFVSYFNCNFFTYQVGFPNNKSYSLIYLSIWQYWWWFWFIFLLLFYYILIFKHLVMRQKKFYPKINTSLKSHGKWGDFLIASIPIYWCSNILINSNTLLKIYEWQYESNYLTIRIRGKQWYWVYKFDFINLNKLYFLNKNVGNNFYLKNNLKKNFNFIFLNYLNHIWSYRFYKKYLNQITLDSNKAKTLNFFLFSLKRSNNNNLYINKFDLKQLQCKKSFYILNKNSKFLNKNNLFKENIFLKKVNFNFLNFFLKNNLNYFNSKYDINYYNRQNIKKNYYFLSSDVLKGNFNLIFKKNISKSPLKSFYISIKQKRIELSSKSKFFSFNNFSKKNNLFVSFKKFNKSNINLASSRLLSTNFTLVLPSNIVICAITNSFDVVHSWFVPGLGIKIDCVPGRSTHHSFFFDVCGLFYGQCAEICGRFHHHMPIKVCIVNFEFFLLWVNHVLIKLIFKKK